MQTAPMEPLVAVCPAFCKEKAATSQRRLSLIVLTYLLTSHPQTEKDSHRARNRDPPSPGGYRHAEG